MALYLVVAHQTAASPELIDALSGAVATDPEAEFVLLVPATPARHLLTWVEGQEEESARHTATSAASTLRRAGLTLRDTLVGQADPLEAVRDELLSSGRSYDQVFISTLPPGLSRWLRRDLPSQLRRLGVPVVHVVSRPQEVSATTGPGQRFTDREFNGESLSLEQMAAWRGSPLYAMDGVVGDVQAVLYDYVSREPVWLGVASRPLPFRTLLVPAATAHLVDGFLVVQLDKQRVLDQPHVDIGEGFASLTDEEHMYRYFGLPFEDIRDIRVLHEGQPIPGRQRNWQNIIEAESPTRTG
jgi:hypothetical protein